MGLLAARAGGNGGALCEARLRGTCSGLRASGARRPSPPFRGGERVSRGVTCIVLGAHARLIRATRRAGRRQGRPGVRGACSRLRLRASGARTTSHRAHRQSPQKVKVCRVASRGCLVHEHGSSGPFARLAGGRDGSLNRLGSGGVCSERVGRAKVLLASPRSIPRKRGLRPRRGVCGVASGHRLVLGCLLFST